MNKPGAIVSKSYDDEAELTTRQILVSHHRVKASASVAMDADNDGSLDRSAEPHAQASTRLGPYQTVCELASGGMATVYLALYRSIEGFEKLCAVKRIHPHLANDREFVNMFADEAQIAARISHPHVCSVFSFGRSQQSPYIAMEFLRGEPLSVVTRRVSRSRELGDDPRFPAIAARLMANFAEGLHAAHTLRDDRGALFDIIHRDVTPQNLFVLYDGSVRVTDFGIAHARRRLHHTEGQKLKGKLSYIAPEQLNDGNVDLRVDVWGLGVTMWEFLAGRRLFLGASEGETLSSVMSRVVQPPSNFRASVPAELDHIVLRALERDVQRRYRSARDLARDLERFLSGIGDQVPAMDLADWMTSVVPEGGERIQALGELAARVSAATAEDTVVRVPSTLPRSSSSNSDVAAAAAPKVARHTSSLPPTREYPAVAKARADQSPDSGRHDGEPGSRHEQKPRLTLVEEPTTIRPGRIQASHVQQHAEPVPESALRVTPANRALRLAALATGGLLLIGLASLAARGRVSHVDGLARARVAPVLLSEPPAPPRPTAEPNTGAERLDDAEWRRRWSGRAAKPAVSVATPPVELAPASPALSKPAGPGRSAPVAAPVASNVALTAGVVLITTPGGSGDVSEQGRPLGRAPGTFRLSIGAHELSLRAPSGTVHTLHVNIQPDTPTLVTVNGAR